MEKELPFAPQGNVRAQDAGTGNDPACGNGSAPGGEALPCAKTSCPACALWGQGRCPHPAPDGWLKEKTGLRELTEDALLSWQLAQLRETAGRLRDALPFYAKRYAGVDIASLRTRADLCRLPFTTADDLLADPWALCPLPARDVARIVSLPTSGSAGRYKRLFFTEADLMQTVDFFAMGMTTMAQPGQRVLICMPCRAPFSVGDVLARSLRRFGAVPVLHGPVGHGTLAKAAVQAAGEAQVLVASPTDAVRLARYGPELRFCAVLLSADYVPQSLMKTLSQQWQCPVYTHYGMTETAFGCAVQCAAGQGHIIRANDLLLEVVNPATGAPLPPGQVGEIVLSAFSRQAMPLLRYRTGDLGSLEREACGGAPLLRLGRVLGRRDGRFPLTGGQDGNRTGSGERERNGGKELSMPLLQEIVYETPGMPPFSARWDGTCLTMALEEATERECALVRSRLSRLGIPAAVCSVPADNVVPTGMEKAVLVQTAP